MLKQTVPSLQNFLWDLCPIYKHIGLTVESSGSGVYRCRIPISEQNLNHVGTVHGCILWAGAEVLGGLVVVSNFDHSSLFYVVRAVTIGFLKPARTDVTAEAFFADEKIEQLQDKLVRNGEAAFDLRSVIRDNHETIVAETSSEYLIRKRRE